MKESATGLSCLSISPPELFPLVAQRELRKVRTAAVGDDQCRRTGESGHCDGNVCVWGGKGEDLMSLEMDMEETDGKSAGDEVKCKSCSASLMPAVTYSRFAKASLFCGWNWKLWPTLSRFLHDRVVHALQQRLPQTPFAPSCYINRVQSSWVTQHESLHPT